jgi:hypothetical protein
MVTATESTLRLLETDGYVVESAAGDLGWVEEVWVDDQGEAEAVAVRTADGRHGLLLDDDVLTVDRESRWVVVGEDAKLLELDVPRLSRGSGRLTSSWGTTGAELEVTARPRHRWHTPLRPEEPAPPVRRAKVERPLWQGIAVLLTTIALLVLATIALAFVVAHLVTGTAY